MTPATVTGPNLLPATMFAIVRKNLTMRGFIPPLIEWRTGGPPNRTGIEAKAVRRFQRILAAAPNQTTRSPTEATYLKLIAM
jgi:hypothetical protein